MLEQLQQLQQKIISTMELLKIDELKNKAEQLSQEMSQTGFWDNQELATTISQDYQDIKKEIDNWESIKVRVNDLLELAQSGDESLNTEIVQQTDELSKEFTKMEFFLLLNGPYDKNNAIIAIHAGSGGTEAQDWAEMLMRMVFRFCEKQGWKTTIVDESRG